MNIILASGSKYRKQLLQRLGLEFSVQVPNIDETPLPQETPVDTAIRLSIAKAKAIAEQHPDAIVIGSDQVATLGIEAIGKAGNFDNAFKQLKQLSGQKVTFNSAMCVAKNNEFKHSNIVTVCHFRNLSDQEITNYLNIEQPFDTAGSAKAESLGISLMQSIKSDDPTAIIGLPLIELSNLLRGFGVNPLLQS